MKVRKRFFIAITVLCLSLCLVAVTANADTVTSGSCGDNLTWTLSANGIITISGTGDMDYDSVPWSDYCEKIVAVHLEEGVKSLGEYAFQGCVNLTSVSLPESLTSMSWYAFSGCSALAQIELPSGMEFLGSYVFENCTALKEITLPVSLDTLGTYALCGCSNLEAVWVEEGNAYFISDENGILYNKSKTKLLYVPDTFEGVFTVPEGVVQIWYTAFDDCVGITEVVLPDSLKSIDNKAFESCTGLTAITIPENVTSIANYVFQDCCNLSSISLPDGLTSLGAGVFLRCSSLKAVTIPDAVMYINGDTFAYCTSLERVDVPEIVEYIGSDAFYECRNLKQFDFPDELLEIGSSAFYYCTSLPDIILPDKVEFIDHNVFWCCKAATKVVIPDTCTYLGASAFFGCDNLTDVTIGNGLTSIAKYTFMSCTSLKSVDIPEQVLSLGSECFKMCYDLETVRFHGDAPTFGASVFGYDTATVYYPADNETWTSEVMQDYDGEIIWEPYDACGVTFKGASLSLNGVIGVNFYVALSDDMINDPNTRMVFTVGETTQSVPMSKATYYSSGDMYIFTCDVVAKQMAEEITAQVYLGDITVGNSLTYGVQTYCANKLSADSTASDTLKNLLIAMLNYGSAAQVYFEYNTDDLANSILTDEQKVMAAVNADDLDDFAMVTTGSDAGISRTGASLLLEADTTVRYYIQIADGYSIDSYNIMYNDKELTPVAAGTNTYYVDVNGIAAKDLDEMYPVTIGGISISYGPMTYVQRQLSSDNANMVNVVTGLYHYNRTANAYFG